MRAIAKGVEPRSLAQHRSTTHADFDNYADKETLRRHLVAEQRGLCCYCLSPIHPTVRSMKVAHWHSRDHHPTEQLDYTNLLGACRGNEGHAPAEQHCDTRQGNRDISRNPALPAHRVESVIRFRGDGRIVSDDQTFDRELSEVLNLNLSFLRQNRKATLDAFQATLRKRGMLQVPTLERLLRKWNGESHADDLEPFCQVVVYWLRKRLNRA